MKAAKRFKTKERDRERSLRKKEQKKCFKEEIVDAPFKSNIITLVEKNLIRNFSYSKLKLFLKYFYQKYLS